MTRCAIALGGNQGDVPITFERALEAIQGMPDIAVIESSRLYRTAPVGTAAGETFYNAVATVETEIAAGELLSRLHAVENELGRRRQGRWSPREIDLDLLHYGDQIHGPELSPLTVPEELVLPHPGCWYRRFVLDPWCDVAEDWRHPQLGETVAAMRGRWLRRPVRVVIDARHPDWAGQLQSALIQSDLGEVLDVGLHNGDADTDRDLRFTADRSSLVSLAALRTVLLSRDLDEAIELGQQILRGVLDEPVPMSD